MMKAKITRKGGYSCCPEGHTVETFAVGEIVEGKIAEWAVADRAASRMMEKKPPKNKMMGKLENK